MSLDTTLSYKSPQTPLFSLVIPPLDPVTVFYLIELFRDILKVVKVTLSITDTFKAIKP
jgi:hypothetical protein